VHHGQLVNGIQAPPHRQVYDNDGPVVVRKGAKV